ncbi:BA14K family protein [Brucella sp. IR073]|uniref:BA14K family protein n=1 Tax=unclassified Brucella TaxID=2632610 RepID=UPI003B988041
MNRFVKTAVLAAASAAVVLAPISIETAMAGKRQRHAWTAGAAGLAAGALIGGALTSRPTYAAPPPPPYDPYAAPPPVAYQPFAPPPATYPYRAQPSYPRYASYQPWTRGWYDYCSRRYRTFNARTGTFRGYDGQDHFCVAN